MPKMIDDKIGIETVKHPYFFQIEKLKNKFNTLIVDAQN